MPSQPTPSPTPTLHGGLKTEIEAQKGDSVEARAAAYDAVRRHASAEFPEWTLEGISLSVGSEDAMYLAAVDMVSGKRRQGVVFEVWMFVKPNGEIYWLAGKRRAQKGE